MNHTSRKRKKHRSEYKRREESGKDDYNKPIETALFVVAHEADIVRGPQATIAAQALEVAEYSDLPEQSPRKKIGSALVKWGGSPLAGFRPGRQRQPAFPGDDDDELNNQVGNHDQEDEDDEIYVDRYDARLLLDSLPPVQSGPIAPSGKAASPGGWSDLPSDAEDTFFFAPDELEDYHREKRRRTMEQFREERLKARLAEEKEDEGQSGDGDGEADVWGGSDEEPNNSQKEFMRRTAVHLHSSPNPAQLEMRILANHGADKRFAFLRGRWSRTWKLIKYKARLPLQASGEETAKEKSDEIQGGRSLGALADYGESDEEETSS